MVSGSFRLAIPMLPFLLFFPFQEGEKEEKMPPGIVAVVNGHEIPYARFYERLLEDWKDKEEGKKLLEQIVENRLVEQVMEKRKIQVEAGEIAEKFRKLREEYREKSGEEKSFEDFLKELDVSEEEFRAQVSLLIGAEKAARQDFQIPPAEEIPAVKLRIWLASLREKAAVEIDKEEFPDGVVAVVNGAPVTVKEMGEELIKRIPASRLETALEGLVGVTLLGLEAGKRGIEITERDIETQLKLQERRYLESVQYMNLKVPFEEYLKLRGETLESFKTGDLFRGTVLRRKLSLSQAGSKEIEEYFQDHLSRYGPRVRLSHIFLRANRPGSESFFGNGKKPEDLERMKEKILAAFKEGKSFEEVAREFSDDVRTKYAGGELGYVTKEERGLGEEILNAAFQMKVGERSGFLRSPQGLHIIKVTEVCAVPKLEEVRPIVEDDFARDWYRTLRAHARVKCRTFK